MKDIEDDCWAHLGLLFMNLKLEQPATRRRFWMDSGFQPPAEDGFLRPGSGSKGPSDRASDLAASA